MNQTRKKEGVSHFGFAGYKTGEMTASTLTHHQHPHLRGDFCEPKTAL
jgi:hypothetical protein